MEFQYFGGNCVRISTKDVVAIIDDNLGELGKKSQTKAGDIAIFTGAHADTEVDTKITIDQPGEFEVSKMSVIGISARAHMDEENQKTATIFKLVADDVRVLITGHIYPELSDDQLESIGLVDVMVIPVGGNGYTLDGVGALKIIKSIEPKLILPVHYADSQIKYPAEQQELSVVLQSMGMEAKEPVSKLKIKGSDLFEGTQVVVLERQ